MNIWTALIIGGFATATLCAALILATYYLWPRAETRIQRMLSEALATPLPQRYRDIDAEYPQLVLDEHNNDA